MNAQKITQFTHDFDLITQKSSDEAVEFWYARDLQGMLEYAEWRNFQRAIEDAKLACESAGGNVQNHFVDLLVTQGMVQKSEPCKAQVP